MKTILVVLGVFLVSVPVSAASKVYTDEDLKEYQTGGSPVNQSRVSDKSGKAGGKAMWQEAWDLINQIDDNVKSTMSNKEMCQQTLPLLSRLDALEFPANETNAISKREELGRRLRNLCAKVR